MIGDAHHMVNIEWVAGAAPLWEVVVYPRQGAEKVMQRESCHST